MGRVQREDAGESAPDATEQTSPEPDVVESDVETGEYIVLVTIGGSRDGVPVPPVGGVWTLPKAEGDEYVKLGYVAPVE